MKVAVTTPAGDRMSLEVIMIEFEAGGKLYSLVNGKLYEMTYTEVNNG